MAGREIDARELDGPRLIRPEELAASRRLGALCFPGFVEEVDEEKLLASYTPPRRGGTQVICHRGVPVSQIAIVHSRVDVYGSPLRIGSIGGVCTHPDYRGMGLATRLLGYCTRKLAAEGARLMLISGMRGLYTRAGCVTAGEFEHVTIRPGRCRPEVGGFSLRLAAGEDALACARLYQAEAVHFVRRAEAFVSYLRPTGRLRRAENWVVEAAGRPAAYLFLGIPWDYLHDRDAGVQEVFEYAGSRVALAGVLPVVMERLHLQELRLLVPWQDGDLLQLLQGQSLGGDRIPLTGHTMRLVDFSGLMRDLRPYVRARLPGSLRRGLRFEQEGDRYAIARGRERLELDGAAMTRLVMGVPAEIDPGPEVGSGALGEVIAALFPLPSFLPGLNYR